MTRILCLAAVAVLSLGGGAQAQIGPFGPRATLVHEEFLPAEPLPPAEATLMNTSAEPLIVQIFDVRDEGRAKTVRLVPGEAKKYGFDRDAGGIVRQVWHVPRYGRLMEQVYDRPVEPRELYQLVVSVERTTYSYRDPKGIGGLAEFDKNSAVSLGVFSLPAGRRLGDRPVIDVAREAAARGNPGEAALFPPNPLSPLR